MFVITSELLSIRSRVVPDEPFRLPEDVVAELNVPLCSLGFWSSQTGTIGATSTSIAPQTETNAKHVLRWYSMVS